MRNSFEAELSPEVREKMKKNIVYVSIFSIVMMFAGLTSAYIVSMGDSFWVKIALPTAFYVSTALIAISSLTFVMAIKSAKAGNKKGLSLWITLTFLLGIGFAVSQIQGYKALAARGIHFSFNSILVNEGRYGDYYTMKFKGEHLLVDANDYIVNGKVLDANQKAKVQAIGQQLDHADAEKGLASVKGYGSEFELYYEGTPLTFVNGEFLKADGSVVGAHDLYRLRRWAEHIRDGRGDFFISGELGKDFNIYFKGQKLEYKDRAIYFEGQKLKPYLLNKAMDSSDTASSYLYIITILHLLHILGTLLFMIRTLTFSFSGKYSNGDSLGLRVTGIFWHFLGLLWLYLLLFLLFIH